MSFVKLACEYCKGRLVLGDVNEDCGTIVALFEGGGLHGPMGIAVDNAVWTMCKGNANEMFNEMFKHYKPVVETMGMGKVQEVIYVSKEDTDQILKQSFPNDISQ